MLRHIQAEMFQWLVKGALFLACITRGGIWSGGSLASPVLGLYWLCEILMWRQPEISTSVCFNPDVSGLPWIQHHTLFSFFRAMEWNICLDGYYHLLTADLQWNCLAPQPSEVQSTFLGHEGTWVCEKSGCLGEKSSSFRWYVDHSERCSSHHPYFFITVLDGEFLPASLLCFFPIACVHFRRIFSVLQEKLWENMDERTISTLVIFSDPSLQSSYEYLSQLSLSRFKAPPNPSPGFFSVEME